MRIKWVIICLIGVILLSYVVNDSSNTKENDIPLHGIKSEKIIIENSYELAVEVKEYEKNIINHSEVESTRLSFFINEDNSIRIENANNNNLFTIVFGNCGVNALYGIKAITYSELERAKDNGAKEFLRLQSGTDWVGPYIVKDKTEDYSQSKPQFTGGWHGTNEDGSGDPTAYTSQVKIYYDGQLIDDLKEGYGKELKIEVTNLINGYNTLKSVIEEVITYKINDRTIRINVVGKALTDIDIERYYGLQSQNSLWDGNVKYVYADGSLDEFSIHSTSNAVIKEYKRVKEYVLSSKDSTFELQVGINSTIGIGNFEYLSSEKPTCFTLNYGKTYFNMVNGIILSLQKDERFEWEGYYKFKYEISTKSR